MQSETREQFAVVVAGLLGVVTGQWLRSLARRSSESQRDEFSAIDMSTLAATPALARIAGEMIGLEDKGLAGRTALAFGTGAVLTLLADVIGRHMPGVLPRDSAAKE
jgi:hypothetical protein